MTTEKERERKREEKKKLNFDKMQNDWNRIRKKKCSDKGGKFSNNVTRFRIRFWGIKEGIFLGYWIRFIKGLKMDWIQFCFFNHNLKTNFWTFV